MVDTPVCERAPIIHLETDAVAAFCEANLFQGGEMLSLVDTKDPELTINLSAMAGKAFAAEVSEVTRNLLDRDVGIAAVDIPIVYDDATDDAIAGALLAIALSSHIMPARLDMENRTPFTLFSASHESNRALRKAGILNISPTNDIYYHSDGSISGKFLNIPCLISVYNITVNYRTRGNFYWIPSSSIPEFEEHIASIGFDDDYLFDLTPAVYGVDGAEITTVSQRRARTAIFRRGADGAVITFMNGTFIGKNEDDSISRVRLARFKADVARNAFRYAVPQEPRRILFLNNAFGFHARDSFENPIEGHEETRIYLRSVSRADHHMGGIVSSDR